MRKQDSKTVRDKLLHTRQKRDLTQVKLANPPVKVLWAKAGVGFGEFTLYNKNGQLWIDNEIMSKEFIKEMLCALVDEATLET